MRWFMKKKQPMHHNLMTMPDGVLLCQRCYDTWLSTDEARQTRCVTRIVSTPARILRKPIRDAHYKRFKQWLKRK